MKSRHLLDVVIRKSMAVLKLLASKDEALLARRDSFIILDLRLNVIDCVGRLDLKSDCLLVRVLTNICIPPRRRRTK